MSGFKDGGQVIVPVPLEELGTLTQSPDQFPSISLTVFFPNSSLTSVNKVFWVLGQVWE